MIAVYTPGDNGDAALLHWYSQLVVADDLQKLVGPSVWPMAAFMRHFTDPNLTLWYLADDQGWWMVAWAFPLMGGGSYGLWVRPGKRGSGSREGVNFIMSTLGLALAVYPVLVNTTKQPEMVPRTERLGYTYLGEIPFLFEGEPCHVLYMTRAMFAPVWRRWKERYERRKD